MDQPESIEPPGPRVDAAELAALVEAAFDEITTHQRLKVLRLARDIVPNVTDEDVRNAQDFGALIADPSFNYEDGMLAGLLAARIALKRRILVPLAEGRPPEPAIAPVDIERRLAEAEAREREM